MKYTILLGKSKFALESKVNAALKDDWLPTGGVAVDDDGHFYQAMTLSEIKYNVDSGWIEMIEMGEFADG